MLEIRASYGTNHREYPIYHNINHLVHGDNLKWRVEKLGIKGFTDVFDNH